MNFQNLFYDILFNQLKMKKISNCEDDKEGISYDDNTITEWIKTSSNKLTELNNEHLRVLNQLKHHVQFPDLYTELYNI